MEKNNNPASINSEESIGIKKSIYIKHAIKTHHGLLKGIEISKNQFFTLYLISLCFALIITIDIFLNFESGQNQIRLSLGIFLIIGLVLGFVSGGFIFDRMKGKRYPVLLILILISAIITMSHIGFFRRASDVIPGILFLESSFVAGLLFILFLIFFLDKTSILERGRILSLLISFLSISVVIVFLLVSTDILILLPVIIFIGAFYYLYKNRKKEEPYKPIKKESTKREINLDIIKYIIILSLFALTIGLMFPEEEILGHNFFDWSQFQVIIIIFLAFLFSLLTAMIVGLIFDFMGRKIVISNIILTISVVNFIKLFDIKIGFFNVALIVIAVLANFISIPLLMADIAQRKNLGKVLGITYSTNIICMILGIFIETIISRLLINKSFASMFLIGIINFVSIVSLFFLVNSKETLSSKEQNWSDTMIHLYVIYHSGLLLYEHSFRKIEENLAESELISGGFVGLIQMLQEITKEKQRLRIIDHGGKKILFGYTQGKKLIIALLITEELLVLRTKLDCFIQDIENRYSKDLDNLEYIDQNLWEERIAPILKKYFLQRYFELAPEFF